MQNNSNSTDYTLITHTESIFLGKEVHFYKSAPSTNAIAAELLSNSKPIEGTAILTFNQTAGKGQRGNSWIAEPGKNIAISYLFFPILLPVSKQFLLTQAIALGVCDFVRLHIDNVPVSIKWPNDIYVRAKKVAGILIENTISKGEIKNSIIGIGINVNQSIFDDKLPNPTSFTLETGKEFNLQQLAAQLSICLEPYLLALKAAKTDSLEKAYLDSLYLYRKPAFFRDSAGNLFQGTISGVAPGGKLIVQIQSEDYLFDIKEISFV
jgi:BirA family biotin operon repressor/biotin-[acetyl-CoA-carboxylase] ligase